MRGVWEAAIAAVEVRGNAGAVAAGGDTAGEGERSNGADALSVTDSDVHSGSVQRFFYRSLNSQLLPNRKYLEVLVAFARGSIWRPPAPPLPTSLRVVRPSRRPQWGRGGNPRGGALCGRTGPSSGTAGPGDSMGQNYLTCLHT